MNISQNMKMSYLLLFSFISFTFAGKIPKSMYDKIHEDCHFDKDYPQFKNNLLFKTCNNWDEINVSPASPNQNAKLCLLYYVSFVSFCKTLNLTSFNETILNPNVHDIDLSTICNGSSLIKNIILDHKQQAEKLIPDQKACETLCKGEFSTNPVCLWAYHYLQLSDTNTTAPNKIKKVQNTNADSDVTARIQSATNAEKAKTTPNEVLNDVSGAKPLHPKPQNQKVDAQDKKADVDLGNVKATSPTETNVQSGKNAQPANQQPQVSSSATPLKLEVLEHQDNQLQRDNGEQEFEMDEQEPPKSDDDDASVKEPVVKKQDENIPKLKTEEVKESTNRIMPETYQQSLDDLNQFGTDNGESYFFQYFMVTCLIFILGYVVYHNKQKFLALIVEGRDSRRSSKARRPNSANYNKLDCNLEEAISSSCSKNSNNVIY